MSKIIIGKAAGKNVGFDIPELLTTRLLVQANSGGGKSWLLRRMAEQLFGKVQTIIIDPEGEFFTLREKFGYVLVGEGGETPADVRSAALLAQKFMELKISAVCDLFEAFRSRPTERRRWVRDFLNALLEVPRSQWNPLVVIVDEAHKFCLDAETEILTKAGWRKYTEIAVGDAVIGFNPSSETFCYEAIQRVMVFHYDGEMVRLRSDGIDQLATSDHRVVLRRMQRAQRQGRKNSSQKDRIGYLKLYPWTFCEAAKVPRHIYVPIGGSPRSSGIPELTEDLARLLGWVITDGCYAGGPSRRYLSISQSYVTRKAGKQTALELAALLERLGGLSRYDRPTRSTQSLNGRDVVHSPSTDFYLGVNLSQRCLQYLGEEIHRIPRLMLEHGSVAQLQALWSGLLEGDGTCGELGWTNFYPGKNEGLADDFQELAIRLGISATKAFVPQIGQFVVHISRRPHHYVRQTTRESYQGKVWDVTVPSGAFIARRNGKAFVTGNCPQETPKAGDMKEREIIGGCKDAMIALSTTGRKRGFCAIWATQRLAKLDKDASAELFNRLVGMTIEDVDVDRAADLMSVSRDDKQEFRTSLRTLDPGQFYAFGRAISKVRELVTVGGIETRHPESGKAARYSEPPPMPDAVAKLLPKLTDLPKEAEDKTRTEAEFKREIRELKTKLSVAVKTTQNAAVHVAHTLGSKPSPPDHRAIERAVAAAVRPYREQLRLIKSYVGRAGRSLPIVRGALEDVEKCLSEEITPAAASAEAGVLTNEIVSVHTVQRPLPSQSPARVPRIPVERLNGDLSGPEQNILDQLAELEALGITQPEKAQLSLMAGYTNSRSGGFSEPLGRLIQYDYARYPQPGFVKLTDEGRAHARPVERPMSVTDLHERLCQKLGGPEAKMLRELLAIYPDQISKEELGAKLNYTNVRSGGFSEPLGRLRSLGIAQYPVKNTVRAADWLFLEAA